MNEGSEKYLFKLIVIGDAGVGKSCLLFNYINNEFKDEYCVTLGVEFASKIVLMPNNTKVKLQIWDTAGQESFRSIVKSFYKKAAAVLLIYNVSKKESFDSLEQWLKEIKENSDERIIKTLVGTQCDREKERKISYEEGKLFQEKNGLHLFFETSAKTGLNITEVFLETAKKIIEKPQLKEEFTRLERNDKIKNNNKEDKAKKESSCC